LVDDCKSTALIEPEDGDRIDNVDIDALNTVMHIVLP